MRKLTAPVTRAMMLSEPGGYWCEGDCVASSRAYLPNGCVDLIITDPPYGIEGDQLHRHYNRNENLVVDGYVEIPRERYEAFSLSWIKEAERVLRPGGSFYLVSGWTNLRDILNALAGTKLQTINHVIWKYNFGVFTRKKFVTSHYHILYLVKPGGEPVFNTYSRYSPAEKTETNRSELYSDMEDVWIIDREYKTGQIRHKNELPKQLLIKLLQYSSNEGDLVADFFAGSFSTAKAAKALKRNSISFEIGPEACAHQVPLVDAIGWGEWLGEIRTGQDDRPRNQKKPWTEEDLARLETRYAALRSERLTKRDAIARLQKEFERGYFSILNALKRFEEE